MRGILSKYGQYIYMIFSLLCVMNHVEILLQNSGWCFLRLGQM